MGVFSPVKETLRRLMRMAASAGVPVASPVVLTQPHRFHAESLRYMAARLFRRPERYAGEPDGAVCAARFQNPYDEIEGVARQIAALVRRGYRYRDIAVIARSLEEYRTAVESVFRRYEIPWFMDERVDVETHPITSLVLTALEAVRGAPDTGKLLRLAKSPLLGIDACDAALLENYCYVWRVEKQQWEAPFQNHPDGFGVVMDQEAEDRLARIEETRQKLMTPLASLRAALEDGGGGVFAKGVFRYLEESGAVEALAAVPASDDVTPQVWDGLCQILDRFYLVMEKVRLPAVRLTELLLSIPELLLVVLLQAIFGKASVFELSLVIGAAGWPAMAKVVRTEVRRLRHCGYMTAARCMGGGFFHNLRCHLAPNFFSSILFMIVMNIRSAMVTESTLSFMGMGLPLEVISWGSILSLSEKALLSGAWWVILFPGVFLIVTLLCVTNIGNCLRENADRRQSNL